MKVVILPIFNEGHFLPYWIPNICDIIEPDIIILNEGLFPKGPEKDTQYPPEFFQEFTSDGHRRSFDFDQVCDCVACHAPVYPETEFVINMMNYPDNFHTGDAYYKAYTHGLPKEDLGPDDIILPIEADLFFHEDDKQFIHETMEEEDAEHPIMAMFQRYFISPFVRIFPDKPRKIFVKWGDGSVYDKTVRDNFTESYQRRGVLHPIRAFHYEWVRPGKYFDARLDMFAGTRTQELLKWHIRMRDHLYKNKRIKDGTKLMLDIKNEVDVEHPVHFIAHEEYKRFEEENGGS